MSLFVFGSAKGSPGVTTAVLALAATWPSGRRVLVAECDPDGGDVAAWFGRSAEPGLVSCAAEGRRGLDSGMIGRHTQILPGSGGARLLAGPAAAEQARAALATLCDGGLPGCLSSFVADGRAVDVLADCGRLSPSSPALGLLAAASSVVLVARPTLSQAHQLRPRVAALPAGVRPVVLLVGSRPYQPEDVAAAVCAPLLGVLADDPQGAAVMSGQAGGRRAAARLPLIRSAREIAGRLARPARVPVGVIG